MSGYQCLYKLGVQIRNSKINDCFGFLKEAETWSLDALRLYQLERLSRLLERAFRNSPYYRAKFAAEGFHPRQLISLADLQSVPVLSKEELLANAKAIQLNDGGEKHFYSETSGSTGTPLVFYRNKEWDAWHNASVLRGYSWHGVEPWERNGYLWGYNTAPSKRYKTRLLDRLQNRFRLFSYRDEEIARFVEKLEKAQYLEGYSSMLYEVAKRVNARGTCHRYDLKLIKGTSEKIYDSYQQEVEKAFGKRIVSEYGSAEGGIIAFECASGNMHVNMETVIVEVVDGEILVTNLVSDSFPIIRYRLGDYISLDERTKCACGMAHPIIREVTGRVGGVIKGKSSDYPSLTLYYVFKNLAMERNLVLNYQVVQKARGELEVHIESGLLADEESMLNREFEKYFSHDLSVTIVTESKLHDFKSKKKDFISLLS